MRGKIYAASIVLIMFSIFSGAAQRAQVQDDARSFKNLGDGEFRSGNYAKALEHFSRAKALLMKAGDSSSLADIYLSEGKIAETNGDLDGSERLFSMALEIYRKSGDPLGTGKALGRIGDLLVYRGEFEKAIRLYDESLQQFQKADDAEGMAWTFQGVGIAQSFLGQHDKAEESYLKALPLIRKLGMKKREVSLYLSMGELYTLSGRLSRAIEVYRQASDILETVDYPLGRGVLFIRWGIVCQSTGESGKALSLFKKALEILKDRPDEFYKGMACGSMANVYASVGRPEEAREILFEALGHYEKAQGPAGLANTYEHLGRLYFENFEDNEKALEMIDKAIPIHQQTNNLWGESSARVVRGKILLAGDQREAADREFQAALKLAEKTGSKAYQAFAVMEQSRMLWQDGDKEKALFLADLSISYCSEEDYLAGVVEARLLKAGFLASLGKKDAALADYESALSLMESERRGAAAPDLQGSYLKSVSDVYIEAVSFMLGNGFNEAAFKVAESLKARLFLDRLAEGLVDVEKGISPEVKARRDDLLGKIDALRSRLGAETEGSDPAARESVKKELKEAEEQMSQFMLQMRVETPAYASVHYPAPIDASRVMSEILRSQEVLVEYIMTNDAVWAFVISGEQFRTVRLPVQKRLLETSVSSYVMNMSRPAGPAVDEIASGRKLHEWLIEPLEPFLGKAGKIIVVPDGILASLPFETLVVKKRGFSGKPVYLLKKRRMHYIQSASVLALMRRGRAPGARAGGFAGFGDPVSTEDLPRIKASGDEVREIAGLFGLSRLEGRVYLREEAKEEIAKSPEMNRFRYVHFACHGLVEKKRQCLVLSKPADGSGDDGLLTLGELMNCDFDARLVVLSACRSGLGEYQTGEGFTGLTRAVLYAGAEAAVVSLWDVDDEGTQDLMARFYNGVIENNGKGLDQSLRQAKLEMLKGALSDPFYWGAFVLYGE